MWGVPPQGRADYAFFQHIAKSLDPKTGRAAILFPHGVLFRRDEAALREALVKSDLVEAVLGMGEGLFYNSPMPAAIVVMRTRKDPVRRGKVLFIDASKEMAREQTQSFLRDEHQQRIMDAYNAFETAEGFAAVATIDQIITKGNTLAITQYVAPAVAGESPGPSVKTSLAQWRSAADASVVAIADIIALLRSEISA